MENSFVIALAKLLEAIRSKHAERAIALICAFLLIAPEPALEPLALAHFAENYRPWIALAFLFSVALAAVLPLGLLMAQGVRYCARYARA